MEYAPIWALVVVIVCALLIAGCGGSGGSSAKKPKPPIPACQLTVQSATPVTFNVDPTEYTFHVIPDAQVIDIVTTYPGGSMQYRLIGDAGLAFSLDTFGNVVIHFTAHGTEPVSLALWQVAG